MKFPTESVTSEVHPYSHRRGRGGYFSTAIQFRAASQRPQSSLLLLLLWVLLPTMPIVACILPVVTFLCQPVLGAFETCVGNQARRFFDFLPNWAGGLFARCLGNPAEEVPESASEVVGAEETLSVIRSHLNDDSVGIIGIYGMGGVGKTTILQRINNEFFESGRQGSFDRVIWVTVSQTVSIPNIQKQIAERLGLSLSDSVTEGVNAGVLFKALSKERFLVLLDDIWRAIDLQVEIGIPRPVRRRRNSKIIFTTRLSQVCDDMGAKSIKVKPLDEVASWKLFSSKLRTKEVILNNRIRPLAEKVADKCGGLPLALITVGRAMANREDIQDWEDAAFSHAAKFELSHSCEEPTGGCIAEEGTQDDAGLLDRHCPMLGYIYLQNLPALKSIGRRPLRLPELRSIRVTWCPELRRIPLDPAGVPKLETIRAQQEWWDTVECAGSGGHDTKPVFENQLRKW
ncbi:hypothetical protein Taro_042485 [Colocasia esculenta]|uniref:AAA+ ATPase domain-containing protein n=1 Tax=Colocasia esculenta TaxID=4460 RepID=A0A843WIK3_COLES|nr:hypothetical protein [Colocasia esculenta]